MQPNGPGSEFKGKDNGGEREDIRGNKEGRETVQNKSSSNH